MTLKENGNRRKRRNILKCDKCKERFEITEEDFVRIGGLTYCECPFCGLQIIIKKR